MQRIYFLKTCSTCNRILKHFEKEFQSFEKVDIKSNQLSQSELDNMIEMAGNIESLFSKRSQQFKIRNLKDKKLTDEDKISLVLDHYTFLKRPVIIDNGTIFIGSDKNTLTELETHFS